MSAVLRFFAGLLLVSLIVINVGSACVLDDAPIPTVMSLRVSAVHQNVDRGSSAQHGSEAAGSHCVQCKPSTYEGDLEFRTAPSNVTYTVKTASAFGRTVSPLNRPPIALA
jgi:hypothetical protein